MNILFILSIFYVTCNSFYHYSTNSKRKIILYIKNQKEEDYFEKFIKYSKERNKKKQEEYLYKYMMYKFKKSLENQKKK